MPGLEGNKVHKADIVGPGQTLQSGVEGWAGQPLDMQEDWEPRAHTRLWELEARGPGIRKALS